MNTSLATHPSARGRLRGAVVGCGNIAQFHSRGWQRIPEVEIVALADPVRETLDDRRARFAPQARVYESLDALLNAEKLDFVEILTPPWMRPSRGGRSATAISNVSAETQFKVGSVWRTT
jgi:hypothetical protein